MASVSHFVLRTRARGQQSGTEIRVNGGAVASVVEVGTSEGTTVEVNDVFYNLPARRKFLKSDSAESAQVSRIVTQLALAYPEIGFVLTSGPRTVLQCPPVGSLKDRLYQLYGERGDLIEVHRSAGGIRLTGYIAALAEQGPTRGAQNVFINRRIIKDRTIAHAIVDAYSVASFKERSPEVHLFLEMPPDALDVNVHPTKAEVRFREQSLVHEVVRRALMDALGQTSAPQLQLRPETVTMTPQAAAIPGILAGGVYPNRWVPGVRSVPGVPTVPGVPADVASGFSQTSPSVASPDDVRLKPDATPVPDIRPMIPLGQFRDTFIVAVDDEGIAIIDQHVAHERVLFEKILHQRAQQAVESQRLLMPIVIEMTAAQQAVFSEISDELQKNGFEAEPFGARSLAVKIAPAGVQAAEVEHMLHELLDQLSREDQALNLEQIRGRIAASIACHAAIKVNMPLEQNKMEWLLAELAKTECPMSCPHGRPVVLRYSMKDIQRAFKRI
jgi:DNA mismatch repair protein MutL